MQPKSSTKSGLKPVLVILGFLGVSMALTLIAIVLQHRGTTSLLANNIVVLTLFNVNLILLIVLLLLLARNLIKLFYERRRNLPGSRFQTKLIVAFVGFSLIPTVLLALVASDLLNRSIDNWFNLQTERSLNRSLDVAQMYYKSAEENTLRLARDIVQGENLQRSGESTQTRLHQDLLAGAQTAFQNHRLAAFEIYDAEGHRLQHRLQSAYAGKAFPWVDAKERRQGVQTGGRTLIRPSGGEDMVIAVAPIPAPEGAPLSGIVVLYNPSPKEWVQKMQEITHAFEEYHQASALKSPIKRSYLLSFLAITLLILFSATWFGYYLSKGITVPIQNLVEATRAVAHGDMDYRIDIQAKDEIGLLVDAFNKMTFDLKQGTLNLEAANLSLQDSNRELDRKRNYVETVLENITAGVISLDKGGHITTLNRSAEKILGISRGSLVGKSFHELFHVVPMEVGKQLLKRIKEGSGTLVAEEFQFEIQNRIVTLRTNIATLHDERGLYLGMVIAFDDVSELIKAQRVAAWQEVAQRMAHEIKNPLTPIQLCAQRLRKKHYEQSPDYDKIFDECTETIIREVGSLKTLLQEFSTFARMPAAQKAPLHLHDPLGEVVRLYRTAHREIKVVEGLDERLPLIPADREQIKRMFINLFENAVESMDGRGSLWIQTAYDEAGKRVRVEVADEGAGIPPEDKTRLFIPYFSRKSRGTGLGLAIVQRIVSDHQGIIRVIDNVPKGTRFVIEFPLTA